MPVEDLFTEEISKHSGGDVGPVHLKEYDLNVRDEHIILGDGGLWSMISADDAVLRSHFFVKVRHFVFRN